jgi:PAS domain S-box-containing protein
VTAKQTGKATKQPAKQTGKSKRKPAKTAARKSEELYRMLVESALDGIVIHVGDRVAFANRAAAALLGFAGPAALVGQPLASFVHPADLANAADRVRRVLAGEAVEYPVEVRYVRRDGTEFPVENTAALVSYKGKPALLSVIRDITERKRAEEALKNSLSLVEATLDTTDNGILVVNPEGAVVKANRRFAEMWRIPGDILASGDDERLLNHVLSQLSDPGAFVAKVKELYGDPVAETADLLYFKDGRVFERTSKPMLVGGEPTARVWSFLDVSERKRAEKALRASEEEYRGLTEHINLGIYRNTVGPEGKFVEANPAIVGMFGYGSKAGFLAMNVSDLYQNPEDRKAFNDKMLKEGFVRGEELWLKRKDGSLFVGSVSAVAVKDEQGQVEYYDGIIDDISERKRTEEALRASEERFRTLYQDSTIGIYRTTPDGRIQLANPALIRMLGYSSFDDLSTRRVVEQDYEPSYPHQEFVDIIERDGEVKGLESAWKRKDGTTFFARESARAVRDSHGNTLYYDGTIEDITERKRAEAALRESEEKFSRAFLTSPYAITITGAEDGKFVEVNDAFTSMTGFTREEALADSAIGLRLWINAEDRQRALSALGAGRAVVGQEFQFRMKSGDVITGSFSAQVLRLGNSPCILSSIADITDRKRAEEEVRQSHQRLELALDGGELGMWDWDLQTDTVTYSDRWAQMLEYRPDEVEPSVGFFKRHVHPDDLPAVLDRLTGHVEGRMRVYASEHRLRTKSGRFFWAMDRGRIVEWDKDGRPVRVTGIIADITERKRAEENYQMLFNEMLDGFAIHEIICDELGSPVDYRFLALNPAFERLTGLRSTEIVGKTVLEALPGTEKHWIDTYGRVALTGEPIHFESRSEPLDRQFEVTAFRPQQNQFACIFNDITDRKRAEEEIRRKAKDLQEKNEELTSFTYAVSHDLRSPLVTIQTFQGYLEQDVRSQDAARIEKDLGYIRNAADKMGLLLDQLLRLSRVGRVTNPPEEAPLQSLVKEALDLVAGRLTARGVQVEVTEEPVMLTGDRTRLVEVFQNLVDNATKFMGDEPAPRVEIGVEQAGEELVLFVRDNGIGIEPQFQPLVFGVFRKLDPGTDGVGLGLALVRRIVELHGGRVWVESEGLGKGTTFRLTLAQTTRKRD